MTTVRDLIDQLATHPADAPVILARDSEGNSFSPLDSLGPSVYVPATTYAGDIYAGRALTPALRAEGYEEEDCYDGPDAHDAIVLWPTY